MEKLKYFILIIIICFQIISCKKEKNKKKRIEEGKIISKNSVKPLLKKVSEQEYIYTAKINAKRGLNLRIDKDVNSEKIINIPFNADVGIISFTEKFEKIEGAKKYDYYGKWVKIEYLQKNNNFVTGYVFDNFLDYQFNKNEDNFYDVKKDTVTVRDAKGFVDALRSNRVIWLDTEVINIEKYIKETELDESLIVGYEEKINFYGETYFFKRSYNEDSYSFGLHDYKNLEIRGKNRQVHFIINNSWEAVIGFVNCSNFLIDNINFYHKLFDDNNCEGDVAYFNNCSSFYFQNSHFDGSGVIGALINDSENFNFLNCEFYNNSKYAIKSDNSKKINFTRCDFHNNELGTLFYMKRTASSFLRECFVTDNNIWGNLVDIDDGVLNLIDSKIEKNRSKRNDYLLNGEISFINTVVHNNVDFYGFTESPELLIKGKGFLEDNIFDTSSDTIATKFNSYSHEGKRIIMRSYDELRFNQDSKKVSYKSNLLNDNYRIYKPSRYDTFFGFTLPEDKAYYAKGKLIDGQLEGIWSFSDNHAEYNQLFVTFKNGVAEGISEERINNKIKSKGYYKNNKKSGVWEYYLENGEKTTLTHEIEEES